MPTTKKKPLPKKKNTKPTVSKNQSHPSPTLPTVEPPKKILRGKASPNYDRSEIDARIARNKDRVIEALRLNDGMIAHACEEAGVDVTSYYTWYHSDPEFKQRALNIREKHVDKSEKKLIQKIDEGDTTALIFHLKCQGKARGYVERQEIVNMDERKAPEVPDSLVKATLDLLMKQEMERLTKEPTE